MPTAYIKKLSKEGKGTITELERMWSDAKEIAVKEGDGDNYALITDIFKKMVKAGAGRALTASRRKPVRINAAQRLLAGRETGSGAGMLMYCEATGRFLLLLRSAESDDPNTWCGAGGGVEAGETVEQAVRREAREEIGFDQDEPCTLIKIGTQHNPDGFVFTNFLGVVYEEFEPELNHEHTDYQWLPFHKFPANMHPRMMKAFATPRGCDVLQQHCNVIPKQEQLTEPVVAQSRDDMMINALVQEFGATAEIANEYLEAADWNLKQAKNDYVADHS